MSDVLSELPMSSGASRVLILLTIQLNNLPYTVLATASRESSNKNYFLAKKDE